MSASQGATMSATLGRVLIIDDEPVVTDVLRELLGGAEYQVDLAGDATTGRARLEDDDSYDAVLLDLMLPDADGMEVLRWIHERRPELAVVMITAYGTVENAVAAMRAGAFHYLTKPFNNEEVRLLVGKAVQTTRLRQENRELRRALEERSRFERIVGKSRPMQAVYRLIEQVAPSRATVLIQGESGTGKELVAHAIHKRSDRADGPFVIVNSGSIPVDLLEDNLFGHMKGAFTGATGDKIGLLAAADGGTLVFDEITTVPSLVQAKLLRVMQEKEFLPLGSVEPVRVDVRILAASNEPVKELVDRGEFREDLYYRLNVIQIILPPLRERLEDLPLLVGHFVERYAGENDKPIEGVDPEAIERLLAYNWPGNVRELENAIERGVILATDERIGVDLLPPEIAERARIPEPTRLPEGLGLSDAVSRYERRLIEEALRQSEGVQKRAAELLRLKPTTLNEKIKRLGIKIGS